MEPFRVFGVLWVQISFLLLTAGETRRLLDLRRLLVFTVVFRELVRAGPQAILSVRILTIPTAPLDARKHPVKTPLLVVVLTVIALTLASASTPCQAGSVTYDFVEGDGARIPGSHRRDDHRLISPRVFHSKRG